MAIFDERFWEIDAFRGIAIVLMIAFHFLYDLFSAGISSLSPFEGILFYFGRLTTILFVFLVGISLSLSFSREQNRSGKFQKHVLRGARIFFLGVLITGVTWIFLPQNFVLFGILHFIGLSIILAYPFLHFKQENLFFAVISFLFGFWFLSFSVSTPFLLWIGIQPEGFHALDYVPLFPWFGIVLLGIFTGNMLYRNHVRTFTVPNLAMKTSVRFLSFLGRNSLVIYLIHQPIIIFILFLLGIRIL